MNEPSATVETVRIGDVLVLSTPQVLKDKAAYVQWFTESIQGTSLEGLRVILLDGGARVEVFRGEHMKT